MKGLQSKKTAQLKVKIKKKVGKVCLNERFTLGNEILILYGPSGSGKSTILNCLAGLAKPDEGEIFLQGRCLFSSKRKLDLPTNLRNIGYVFQEYALFPHLTVKENVTYSLPGCKQSNGRDDYRFSIKDILDMCRIVEIQEKYPGQLSGGEKQRVALARALMREPDLLLLDEPLSALDRELQTHLLKEIRRLHQLWEIPFIYVTHCQREAEFLGDKMVYLQKGH